MIDHNNLILIVNIHPDINTQHHGNCFHCNITTIGARFDSEKNCVVLEKDCPDFKKWPGTYEKIGNRLYLYPFDIPNAVFVFDYGADGALIFNKGASKQMKLTFEDQSLYQPIDPNS